MEKSKMEQDETIRNYIERIVALRHAIQQPSLDLGDLKREAKADGLNIEVLDVLTPLIRRYPHDNGAGVLNEIIRYAEIFGAEVLASKVSAGSHVSAEPGNSVESKTLEMVEVHSPPTSKRDLATHAPLRLSTQVIAALGLTIGLIWLLN